MPIIVKANVVIIIYSVTIKIIKIIIILGNMLNITLFIKKIRDMENDIRSEVPVIAITADESESGKEKIIKSGMNGYITKPYDIKAILDKLSGILL